MGDGHRARVDARDRSGQQAHSAKRLVVVRTNEVVRPPRLECDVSDVAKVDNLLLLWDQVILSASRMEKWEMARAHPLNVPILQRLYRRRSIDTLQLLTRLLSPQRHPPRVRQTCANLRRALNSIILIRYPYVVGIDETVDRS